MKIVLSVASQVVGFYSSHGEDWGANYGRPEMQSHIDREIMPRINAEAEEWTLTFKHLFLRTNIFGMSKRGIKLSGEQGKRS
jgi:hypothetical protein